MRYLIPQNRERDLQHFYFDRYYRYFFSFYLLKTILYSSPCILRVQNFPPRGRRNSKIVNAVFVCLRDANLAYTYTPHERMGLHHAYLHHTYEIQYIVCKSFNSLQSVYIISFVLIERYWHIVCDCRCFNYNLII